MNIQNKRLGIILSTVVFLLLIPLVAMQFSNEVKWTLFDFLVAGVLLLSTGLACEMALRKVKQVNMRVILVIVILLIAFLIWAELAVGVFGTPLAGS